MKKKMAVLVPSMAGGGAEKVVVNLLRNIDKEAFDVHLVLVRAEGPYMDLVPDSISMTDLNAPRVRYALTKLIKTLNSIQPELIFSTLDELNLALVLVKPFLKQSPKLIVREANTPSKTLSTLSSLDKTITQFLYRRFYPKADLIIAQCDAMKQDIIRTYNLPSEKITYIYNPLDIHDIRNKALKENPYDTRNINLLAVGRLSYQKGFDVLLRAFKHVLQEEPSARLTLLGEGELLEDLSQLAVDLQIDKQVDFSGFKKNPYPYYFHADTYVLSSRWEGFPNSLLEALACGTKVVATDCQSGPREILLNNDYGLLVEEENPEALAAGILESIRGENKSSNRADRYHIDSIMTEYEEVFLHV
ncbi:glycosyltransferase [Atopococcus tabaci]|uniref:glycosyltransferase n=1 Tax=Atopococcus tabaci TaxID=269774 RepID=UPI000426867C|nr:glycosyltransferase [Atopococcus tabaci]